MTGLEIALLIGGALIFVASFLIPVKQKEASEDVKGMVEKEVKNTVEKELETIKTHIDDVVDEAAYYAQEKTERSLERISNEKIMAVNEYSDTVLEEINKNHKEVMFLYDMLNDKHENLMESVNEANEAAKAAQETAAMANEAVNSLSGVASFASEAVNAANNANSVNVAEPAFTVGIQAENVVPVSNKSIRTLKWAALAEEEAGDGLANMKPADSRDRSVEDELKEYFTEGEGADSQNALHQEILALHKLGQSDVEIARALNMGVGEVSLIIGLHSK